MKTSRILFVTALVLSLGMQAEAKKVKLLYQLKTGDHFLFEKTTSQSISQEMMGQAQTTNSKIGWTYEVKVTGVSAAGDYQMTGAMVDFSMSTTSPMGDMNYNSATDTVVPDFAKSMAITMNAVYAFNMSPQGLITNMKAPDGLGDKIKKLFESMGGGAMQMAAVSIADASSADGFQRIMESMLIHYPDGGAAVKDTWEGESKIQQIITLLTKSKCELTDATKTVNSIKVTTQITQDPATPPMEMQGMNINYELLGASEGTMQLDAESGIIISSELSITISGTISIDSPQLPSPMSIPMTVQSIEKVVRK